MASMFRSNLSQRPAQEIGNTSDHIVTGVNRHPDASIDTIDVTTFAQAVNGPLLHAKAQLIAENLDMAQVRLPMESNQHTPIGHLVAFDRHADQVYSLPKTVVVADLSQTESMVSKDFDPVDLNAGFSPYSASRHLPALVGSLDDWHLRSTDRGYSTEQRNKRWFRMLQNWHCLCDESKLGIDRWAFAGVSITDLIIRETRTHEDLGGHDSGFLTCSYSGTYSLGSTYNHQAIISGSPVFLDIPTPEEAAKATEMASARSTGGVRARQFVPFVLRTRSQLLELRRYVRDGSLTFRESFLGLRHVGVTTSTAEPYGLISILLH